MDDRPRGHLSIVAADGQRVPPHSTEAEAHVIGGLMLDNSAFERIGYLKAEDFYDSQNRAIYAAILALIEQDRAVDVFTLSNSMEPDSPWQYLAEVCNNVPTAANIHRYAEIVRGKADLRRLSAYAVDVGESIYAAHANPTQAAQQAEAALGALLERREQRDLVDYQQALHDAVDEEDDDRRGAETGLADLDAMLPRGMLPGQLIVVAARPGMGKTSLALGIAEHVARTAGVAVFSLEMTRGELASRGLSWATRGDKSQRSHAIGTLGRLRLKIDDTPGVTVAHIRARAQRARREFGDLGLVVVDHLQLIHGSGENRHLELSATAKGLKALAKDLRCAVLLLSQLNRGVETRTDRRPVLSDLRESGAIEEDADAVLMLYRDAYYQADTYMGNTVELLVRKNRGGRTGDILLTWIPQHTRLVNHSGERPKPPVPDKPRAKTITIPNFARNNGGGD